MIFPNSVSKLFKENHLVIIIKKKVARAAKSLGFMSNIVKITKRFPGMKADTTLT